MPRKRKFSNWILRLACALLCLTLLTTYWSAGLFARYASTASNSDSARVAAFVFDVADTQAHMITLEEITQPGDSVTYSFTVTNTRGTAPNKVTSEVEQTYQLTMELAGSLPLVSSLSGGDTITLMNYGKESGSSHIMQAAVEENTSYSLTVTWPEEQNDIIFSRAGLAHLALSISAQQAD